MNRLAKSTLRWLAMGSGVAAGAYGAYVATTWYRYGRPRLPRSEEADALLDRFMPEYEVVERHHMRIAAPAEITLATAGDIDPDESAVIRAIFKARELILRSEPGKRLAPGGLLAQTKALGWAALAEVPGREIVMGAVTQPWAKNVVFRAVAPDRFADFDEPGYVKIVWTLRADPISDTESIFRTETRATATDAEARARFRLYWAFLSLGINLIRRMMLGPQRREAERRFYEHCNS